MSRSLSVKSQNFYRKRDGGVRMVMGCQSGLSKILFNKLYKLYKDVSKKKSVSLVVEVHVFRYRVDYRFLM